MNRKWMINSLRSRNFQVFFEKSLSYQYLSTIQNESCLNRPIVCATLQTFIRNDEQLLVLENRMTDWRWRDAGRRDGRKQRRKGGSSSDVKWL